LVKVIKSVVRDHLKNQQNGKQPDYSFEDWEFIFHLMGVLKPLQGEEASPPADEIVQIPEKRGSLEEWRNKKGTMDWLHGKNPLNATETLTEWILLTLVEKLELELLEVRRKMGHTPVD
jgi:potassium channel subfamily K, other eukaryote